MASQAVLYAFCGLVLVSNGVLGMRQQAVGVKGILVCGEKPAAGVQVKLWDEDDGPDPDE